MPLSWLQWLLSCNYTPISENTVTVFYVGMVSLVGALAGRGEGARAITNKQTNMFH